MVDTTRSGRRFVPFFRRYTKTWVHAVATAGLTAFGMLTFVNRGFVLVAVAVYVLPPVVLYFRGANPGTRRAPEADSTEPNVRSTNEESGVRNTDIGNRSDEENGNRSDDETDEGDTDSTVGSDTESHAESDAESGSEDRPPTWTLAETSTDGTLFDTTVTDEDAYAVGENGVVLRDEPKTDDWEIALEDGPGANAADLHGVDATSDGNAVWVAGDSGALGRFDGGTNRHVDHSAPRDITDNWSALAVAGTAGVETILLVNGSGQVLRGRYRDGDIAWDTPVKPGSGSSMCGATMVDATLGYLCDTNDGVFATDDGGESFRRIGIDDVNGTLTDVAASGDDRCYVTADDGVCYRYADGTWTPTRVGDGNLSALSLAGDSVVACGDSVVYERTDGSEWERTVTPARGTLHGVALDSGRAVAVGEDGTVVERDGG